MDKLLGTNIYARRIQCGLDQKELAERVCVSYSTISRIEDGTKSPSLALMTKIADVLDSSIDELLGRNKTS